jgi:hypothetical protein
MWQDPVVVETRSLREAYAARFRHDADAIFEDILHRQTALGKKLVTFPSRIPLSSNNNEDQSAKENLGKTVS